MNLRNYSIASMLLTVLAVFTLSTSRADAQQYYTIDGKPGGVTSEAYGYVYNYPNYQYLYYAFYMWYDYMKVYQQEFILSARDLNNAGMCAGPISSLSLKFVRAVQWNAKMRILMKPVPSTMYALPNNNWQCIDNANPANLTTGTVEVYNNPTWSLNPIANRDTTWVEFSFSNNFVWDGSSNIVVFMCRENNSAGLNYNYQGTQHLLVEVSPPNASSGYSNYNFPMRAGYSYTFNTPAPTCNRKTIYGTYPVYLYQYNYQTYVRSYTPMRPLVRLKSESGVTQSFPEDLDPRRILRAGDVYNGATSTHPKPSLSYYATKDSPVSFTYKIVGPLPATTLQYEAKQSGNTTISQTPGATGNTTYVITEASGNLAGTAGALDLTNATGGSYRVVSTFTSDCGTSDWTKQFIVSFPNDVAMGLIRSPQTKPKKNPVNITLPLSCLIQNVGLNEVTDVDVTATVRSYPGGNLIYTKTTSWNGSLNTGDRATVDVTTADYIPNAVGLYSIKICAELKSATDQQADNDCLPQPGLTHIFEVNYNEEAAAGTIITPSASGNYFANRPLQPQATVANLGILDLSNVPVLMEIFKLPGRAKVYNQRVVVQSVDAAVPNNLATAFFPLFTPDESANYEVCMTVEYPGDKDPTNDKVCQTIFVDDNLNGTYTVGTTKANQNRNFNSFDLAIDELYRRGVSGPVTFELTDAAYTVGSGANNEPALDLTTYVSGMSAKNTVTFKPSLSRSLSMGSVVVTLNSANGQGVVFGQNLFPSNTNAVANQFPYVRSYSNSAGFYRFDGGQQKSIRFDLNASTPHRAVFYLGDGSSNISITNCILGNAPSATPSYGSSLPRVFYTNGRFTYESDVRTISGVPTTYSAGIVSRNKVPVGASGNNTEALDTNLNSGNNFSNNEISGFGYGIATMGMGTLLKAGLNQFVPYYNTGTKINGNLITNVSRAGIFVGYEDGAEIMGNRIYGVGKSTGTATKDAAGIYAGGQVQYNSMDLRIVGNEISAVSGDSMSRGIVVDQTRNSFQSISSAGGIYTAPSRSERTNVNSNAVWGLSRGTTTGSMAGVHLLTGRMNNDVVTPASPDYFTKADTVANNTIIISNDNVIGSGAVVGIGSQHGNGTVVVNNAVAMMGNANASSFINAALLYQGTLFRNGRANSWYLPSTAPGQLVSNNNAFWAPNAGIARFIEISDQSVVVSTGTQTEFQSLSQWRTWAGQDINSVSGDFTLDHEYRGIAPNQKLRVRVTPTPPIGSVLNNRGLRLSGVTTDIDGAVRGQAGLGYDIGANEFDGRMYLSDLESVDILKPSAYRSGTGATSDAEYIMTKAPVDVTARFRNNGALALTNAPVRVRVFMETAASNNTAAMTPAWNALAAVDKTVNIDLASGELTDVVFNVADFTPQVYFGMFGYTAPARFTSMINNVTPRYLVEVSTTSDENNQNNVFTKVVRFFLLKSQMHLVLSVTGSTNDISTGTPAQNDIVGRLNADTLTKSFRDLGFLNLPASSSYAYDIFDRSAWESRAVDYTMYRTMFWSHDQNALSRTERDDIRNFVAAGAPGQKKNLAIGAQNLARQHQGLNILSDENFIRTVLRAKNQSPGQPTAINYDSKKITGRTIARNTVETIVRTGFPNDADPVPGLVSIYSDATTSGLASMAYSYNKGDRTSTDSIAGTAVASLTNNTVYLAIDWRHLSHPQLFTGGDRTLRGIIDFFESNGGTVVPVELTAFDAKARGSNVDVFWSTASERNSDRFLVERSTVAGPTAGNVVAQSPFTTVGTVSAAGNSTSRRDYRLTDNGVAAGTYAYRLTTVDVDGSASTTSDVQVTIDGEGTQLMIASVSPNPVANISRVSFTTATAGEVTLVLVNANGAEVMTLVQGTRPAGTQEVDLSAATLASGTYTLVLRSHGAAVSAPVTIVK